MPDNTWGPAWVNWRFAEPPRARYAIAVLRRPEVSDAASKVAVLPEVRSELLEFQRAFAKNPPGNAGGAVLDGRDIGTVIAPDATVKLWVDADVSVRAQRRTKELISRGEAVSEADILADLIARDTRDAPNMLVAPEAVRIDTTALGIEESVAAAMTALQAQLAVKGL